MARTTAWVVHGIVLLCAAGADVGAFYQIISLVMWNSVVAQVYVVTLGFSVTAIYLAHLAATFARRLAVPSARTGWPRAALTIATSAWTVLGISAFTIRITGSGQVVGGVTGIVGDFGSGPVDPGPSPLPGATMFLALYIATGAAAAVGAYSIRTWPENVGEHVEPTRHVARLTRAERDGQHADAQSQWSGIGESWADYRRRQGAHDDQEETH